MKKNKNSKWMHILGRVIVSVALMVTKMNVNSTCVFIANQSKLPETAKKLRKF